MSVIRTHPLRIGSIHATVLEDGPLHAPAAFIFSNADSQELASALADAGLEAGSIGVGLAGMLLETPAGERILLDAGTGGRWHEGLGHLPEALAAIGRSPYDIDLVVVSHGHPDHLGGLLDETGGLRYPNARHVMSEIEWKFWSSPSKLATVDRAWADLALEVIPRLGERLWLTQGPTAVAAGVTTLPSPGHTPGHMGVRVASEGHELLWFGDAFGHPLGVTRPDWAVGSDGDVARSERTRRELIDLAVQSGATVFVNHFPFPAVGRVERDGDVPVWKPAPRTGAEARFPVST